MDSKLLLTAVFYVMALDISGSDQKHVCASWKKDTQTGNKMSSGCTGDSEPYCDKQTCSSGITSCIAIYSNKTGQLRILYLGCELNKGDPFLKCGNNSCPLIIHNGGISQKYLEC